MNSTVAVLGAGAWGTALAVHAARTGAPTRLWARDPGRAATIAATRINPRLPGTPLPASVAVTGEMAQALDDAALILLAIPVQHLRHVVGLIPRGGTPLLVCAKGIETATLRMPLEIVAETAPARPAAVLSGPNFAAEIAAGLPAAAVVAASDPVLRHALVLRLASSRLRLYGNEDVTGVQLGGAAKNVIAIAAGVVMGAGLGENARAALVTRGLAELSRLTVALGGRAETVMGLSGLGDLLLTCTGERSRNFSLGVALGRGRPLSEIMAGRDAVTEGVATAPALVARARGVEMPVCAAVATVLAGALTPLQAMDTLLARRPRDE